MDFSINSMTGTKHLERGTVCQDASAVKLLSDDRIAACVCDGLGSCAHSDIAARIGAETFVNAVADEFPEQVDDETMKKHLFRAAQSALDQINQQVYEDHGEAREYETTLHGAVFLNDGMVYVLHAGDGAVIVLHEDGKFSSTSAEKHSGELAGAVIPLSGGEKTWEVYRFDHVCSVLMTTDGMLPVVQPALLRIFGNMAAYPAAVLPLMDKRCCKPDQLQETMDRFLRAEMKDDEIVAYVASLMSEIGIDGATAEPLLRDMFQRVRVNRLLRTVTDDKTMILLRSDILPSYDSSIFQEPDWRVLEMKQFAAIYPHLMKKDVSEQSSERVLEEETEKDGDEIENKEVENVADLFNKKIGRIASVVLNFVAGTGNGEDDEE